ncbi:MAG: hypothetical protein ACRYG7_45360 [Janthinobacterium lividum]
METTNPTRTEKVIEAALAYYRLADSFSATLPDALAWYETVPPDIQQEIGLLAPHKWLTFPNFKRYLLEKNGISLHTYMATHLAAHDLNHWLLHGDGGIGDGGIL